MPLTNENMKSIFNITGHVLKNKLKNKVRYHFTSINTAVAKQEKQNRKIIKKCRWYREHFSLDIWFVI